MGKGPVLTYSTPDVHGLDGLECFRTILDFFR